MQIVGLFLLVIAVVALGFCVVLTARTNSRLRGSISDLRSRLCHYTDTRSGDARAVTCDCINQIIVAIADGPIVIHIKSFAYDNADEQAYAQICADELCDEINKQV